MLIRKLARLLCALAMITFLAASCSSDTPAIDTGTEAASGTEANASDSSADTTEPTAVPPTSAPEPAARAAESEEATSQDQDTTATSDDDNVIVLDKRDLAILYIVSDGYVPRDAECIVDAAYGIFGTWYLIGVDPDPEQAEELNGILNACITMSPGPPAGSAPPGDDSELDALWVACDAGSASACEDLYSDAPSDSDYEAFGFLCGGRVFEICSSLPTDDNGDSASGEIDGPAAGSAPPGNDSELDALWVACDAGSGQSCDDLVRQASPDSDYEAFGLSCGGHIVSVFSCSELLDG